MDIFEAIKNRRSIRKFSNKEIKQTEIETMIRMAMQAPTARGQKPWRFLVVSDKKILKELSNILSNGIMLVEASLCIILVTDKSDLASVEYYPQDMAAATQNLMLAATALNIGSCWLGTYPNIERMEKLEKLIPLPENCEYFSMIALGYPKDEADLKFIDKYDSSRIHYDRF
ncbi:MAG: nitroreductase family protein [Bacilli bacterium]|jgi:nitroreductase